MRKYTPLGHVFRGRRPSLMLLYMRRPVVPNRVTCSNAIKANLEREYVELENGLPISFFPLRERERGDECQHGQSVEGDEFEQPGRGGSGDAREEEQGEREMMLQDFLAKEGRRSSDGSQDIVGLFRPRPTVTATASVPTTTLLSLNSIGCNEMHYLDWLGGFDSRVSSSLHDQQQQQQHPHRHNRHHQNMEDSQEFGPFCRKRGGMVDGGESVDRRQKRMIKNRESAARSRARKQAYTNELEIEIAHLVEENIKLREQQQQQNQLRRLQEEQQMCGNQGAGSRSAKAKPILRRTSTAPF